MDTTAANAEMLFAPFRRVQLHMRKTTLRYLCISAETVEMMQGLQVQLKNEVCMLFFFCFVDLETKRYCFGFHVNCLLSGGYYSIRRIPALVTTRSTRSAVARQKMALRQNQKKERLSYFCAHF